MTFDQHAAGDRPRDPHFVAAFDDIKPYFGAVGMVTLLGTPAEFAVPIVRRLRGRSGISIGPGIVNLANGVVALGAVHVARRCPSRRRTPKHRRIARAARIASLAYLALSPAAAGGWQRAVILGSRSPLWGGLFSPVALLNLIVLATALVRARRTRRAGLPGESEKR